MQVLARRDLDNDGTGTRVAEVLDQQWADADRGHDRVGRRRPVRRARGHLLPDHAWDGHGCSGEQQREGLVHGSRQHERLVQFHVDKATANDVLILADTDYTARRTPAYPAGTTSPPSLSTYVQALADGTTHDVYDVDAMARPPINSACSNTTTR